MQISDPQRRFANNPQGNVTFGAEFLVGCGVKKNVIDALVCYNAGSGTLAGIKSGRIRSTKVRYWIPGKGYQRGRVPTWSCKIRRNCVSGYVKLIITTWQELAHSKPRKSAPVEEYEAPAPPGKDSEAQEGGVSPYMWLAAALFYFLYRHERGKKKKRGK
jgi:hypothetical protein